MKNNNPIQVDFSADCNLKERLREQLQYALTQHDITEGEVITMKRTLKQSTRIALIALISLIVLSSVAALASLKAFSLGPFAAYSQHDGPEAADFLAEVNAHRADWAGKLYDADGQLIDDLAAYITESRDLSRVYDGERTNVALDLSGGEFKISPRTEAERAVDVTRFADLEAVRPLVGFDFVLPASLPEGYELDHFELFNEHGKPIEGGKYLTVVYAKPGASGSEFDLMLQLMDEETAYEVTASGVVFQEFKIRDHDALTDGKNLDVLVGDVMYQFSSKQSGLPLDDLVRMVESI